ncbi:MAG: FHA domain-containing protein [Oscillospiraceae bacterium]|nr:FHA domain-containing protein [Oscillospiraceae bacterium]
MLLTNRITGEKHQLTGEEYSIGRSETSEIVIKEPTLSRKHARITRAGNDWFIEDLFSTNGVTLNGEKITAGEKVRLSPGDRIVLGTTVSLLFEKEEDEEERTVGVQFFRKEREMEVKERPEPPVQSEPEVAVRPSWSTEDAAPVRPLWAEEAAPVIRPAQQSNAVPVHTVRGQNAAPVPPVQPPKAPPVKPAQQKAAPAGDEIPTYREFVKKFLSPGIRKTITAASIAMYVACGILLAYAVLLLIRHNTGWAVAVLLCDAALIPLSILTHKLKSKGLAITQLCFAVLAFLISTMAVGQMAGFLPMAAAIVALVFVVRADKEYQMFLSN